MFHATIRFAQDCMRFSGEASPYNVQIVRDYAARHAAGTRVEVRAASPLHATLRRALGTLARRGILVVLEG